MGNLQNINNLALFLLKGHRCACSLNVKGESIIFPAYFCQQVLHILTSLQPFQLLHNSVPEKYLLFSQNQQKI